MTLSARSGDRKMPKIDFRKISPGLRPGPQNNPFQPKSHSLPSQRRHRPSKSQNGRNFRESIFQRPPFFLNTFFFNPLSIPHTFE